MLSLSLSSTLSCEKHSLCFVRLCQAIYLQSVIRSNYMGGMTMATAVDGLDDGRRKEGEEEIGIWFPLVDLFWDYRQCRLSPTEAETGSE